MVNGNGNKAKVSEGYSVFVEANEIHQFQNPFEKNFEFLCIIPNPDNR